MKAREARFTVNPPESRSKGSRWFMIVSLLAMVVVLSLVGLGTQKPLRRGTPVTPAARSAASSTPSDGSAISEPPPPDGNSVGNN